MNPPSKKDTGLQHIDDWQHSGLSRNADGRQKSLKSSQFSYWKRKLTTTSTSALSPAPKPAFVPVTVSEPLAQGLCLRLPNGCEFSGIQTQNLPTLQQWLEGLL